MKDYEKYEQELRAEFVSKHPNATPEQLIENYRENTGLVMAFIAQKNVDAIDRDRIERINDWLGSAWRGSRGVVEEIER